MEIVLIADNPEVVEIERSALQTLGYSTLMLLGDRMNPSASDLKFAQLFVVKNSGAVGPCVDRVAWLSRMKPGAPILVTTDGALCDEVQALQSAGASEVLIAPYRADDLRQRVLRLTIPTEGRRHGADEPVRLRVVRDRLVVQHERREIRLSPSEMAVLLVLAQSHGNVVARTIIMEALPNASGNPVSNAVDVYVARLRAKLAVPCIRTVRGGGYLLERSVEVAVTETR